MKSAILALSLMLASPLMAATVSFEDLKNVSLDGANAGDLSAVKFNYAVLWPDISRQVIVKVRERCSDAKVPYATAKAQVAAAEACGLVIPAADKADLEKRK